MQADRSAVTMDGFVAPEEVQESSLPDGGGPKAMGELL